MGVKVGGSGLGDQGWGSRSRDQAQGGVKVWGQGLGRGQVWGSKLWSKLWSRLGSWLGDQGRVMIGGHKVWDQGRGSMSGGEGQGEGVKVRCRGSRSGGLGSDGWSGLVGGGWRQIENGSFKKLMIEFHSNPFHSMFYPMPIV